MADPIEELNNLLLKTLARIYPGSTLPRRRPPVMLTPEDIDEVVDQLRMAVEVLKDVRSERATLQAQLVQMTDTMKSLTQNKVREQLALADAFRRQQPRIILGGDMVDR